MVPTCLCTSRLRCDVTTRSDRPCGSASVVRRVWGTAGWCRWASPPGEALENRFQSCQQPAFITITQGQLHLAASEFEVDVHRRWCFRERRCWYVSLRRCRWCIHLSVARFRLDQFLCTP